MVMALAVPACGGTSTTSGTSATLSASADKGTTASQPGTDSGCDPKKEACGSSGGGQGSGGDMKGAWPDPTAKYIVADPVDLSQIEDISKYRSCAGHDRSGYSFDRVLETTRSMKHYFYPVPAFQGTLDKVKVFAPFDGTVTTIFLEKDKVDGRPHNGNGITMSPDTDKNAFLGFGHVYFVHDFAVGDRVKAGDLLGYATLGDKDNDFDIDLMGSQQGSSEILGSIFDHMDAKVLTDFAAVGATPENAIIPKAERDAAPCNFDAGSGRPGPDWVTLTD